MIVYPLSKTEARIIHVAGWTVYITGLVMIAFLLALSLSG